MFLVEQEVVGDDRTAFEAVTSANEELAKLQKEVAFLQNSFSAAKGENEDFDCNGDDVGEKLADLYEKLQILGSDAAEAQASNIILAGLGFTKKMQCHPTRSFSGGRRMRISLENGTVSTFPGTFEEYKEQLQREIKAEVDD